MVFLVMVFLSLIGPFGVLVCRDFVFLPIKQLEVQGWGNELRGLPYLGNNVDTPRIMGAKISTTHHLVDCDLYTRRGNGPFLILIGRRGGPFLMSRL